MDNNVNFDSATTVGKELSVTAEEPINCYRILQFRLEGEKSITLAPNESIKIYTHDFPEVLASHKIEFALTYEFALSKGVCCVELPYVESCFQPNGVTVRYVAVIKNFGLDSIILEPNKVIAEIVLYGQAT